MNKSVLLHCSVVAAASCMAACTSLRVTTDSNPKLSVASCRTYNWAGNFTPDHGRVPAFANPLNESRLRSAIATNLQAKSVTLAAENSPPDCLIGYGIGVHRVVEGYPYPYAWGGWGWRHGYVGMGWSGPYVYHEGSVAVDIYDGKTKQPIWHASANQNVAGLTGTAAETKINAAVAAIFTKYQ